MFQPGPALGQQLVGVLALGEGVGLRLGEQHERMGQSGGVGHGGALPSQSGRCAPVAAAGQDRDHHGPAGQWNPPPGRRSRQMNTHHCTPHKGPAPLTDAMSCQDAAKKRAQPGAPTARGRLAVPLGLTGCFGPLGADGAKLEKPWPALSGHPSVALVWGAVDLWNCLLYTSPSPRD